MANLPSAAELTSVASLLAPGFVILGIRARFKDGVSPDLKDKAVGYAIASTAYYAAISPLFHVPWGLSLPLWFWGFSQFFLVPALLGLVVVWFDQAEWFYRLSSKVGFRLAHHVPTAWDYAFSRVIQGTYVWVKLANGTEYAGKLGRGSFASSSAGERDLYIEEVWRIEADKPWTLVEPPRGVLLCGKDIRCVEIFKRI